MANWQEQQQEFKIQKGIRDAEDSLVIAIEARLQQEKTYGDLQKSQYRNLMHVADTTSSIAVIKNFLRYQLGREDKWGKGENSLAEKIIEDIDKTLKLKAQEIINKSESNEAEKLKKVWLELTRRYLGYGSRYLTYLNEVKKNRNQSSE